MRPAGAEELGLTKVASLLQKTLDEESAANETLTKVAIDANSAAMAGSEEDESDAEAVSTTSGRGRRS